LQDRHLIPLLHSKRRLRLFFACIKGKGEDGYDEAGDKEMAASTASAKKTCSNLQAARSLLHARSLCRARSQRAACAQPVRSLRAACAQPVQAARRAACTA